MPRTLLAGILSPALGKTHKFSAMRIGAFYFDTSLRGRYTAYFMQIQSLFCA